MRALALLLLVLAAPALLAQDAPRKKQKQKQLAHKKPTPEQIRKFNELQKKKQ